MSDRIRRSNYGRQAERYYISGEADMQQVLTQFGADLRHSSNIPMPIAGLFLAAARSVNRMRTAPLETIHADDLPFAREVVSIFTGSIVGSQFKLAQVDRRQYGLWHERVMLYEHARLTGIALDVGFDASIESGSATSADSLDFMTESGVAVRVDCPDLWALQNANTRTTLTASNATRQEVTTRFAALQPPGIPPS